MKLRSLFSLSLLLGLLGLLVSCGSKSANLKFDLQGVDSNYRILYYDGTGLKEAGVPITDGNFEARMLLQDTTIAFLYAGSDKARLIVEIAPGDKILFRGSEKEPLTWSIEGGAEINGKYSSWRHSNAKLLKTNNVDSINWAVSKFVKKHPEAPLSAWLLLFHYNGSKNPEELQDLWKMLKPSARASRAAVMLGRLEMLSLPAAQKGKLTGLKLFTGADTLTPILPSKAKKTIILLGRGSRSAQSEFHDSLERLLSKEKSSTLRIVDISFEHDSITWRHLSSRDSVLKKMAPQAEIIKAWASGEEFNPALKGLQAPRYPAIFILDSAMRYVD